PGPAGRAPKSRRPSRSWPHIARTDSSSTGAPAASASRTRNCVPARVSGETRRPRSSSVRAALLHESRDGAKENPQVEPEAALLEVLDVEAHPTAAVDVPPAP